MGANLRLDDPGKKILGMQYLFKPDLLKFLQTVRRVLERTLSS